MHHAQPSRIRCKERCLTSARVKRRLASAFTLVEALIAMTIMATLASFAVPHVMRTMEQAHADMAAASLTSLANAQRFYWLENRTYATELSQLEAAQLISADLLTSTNRFEFAIDAATNNSFTVSATRIDSDVWTGILQVDQTGTVTGEITQAGSNSIAPGFQ